MPAPVRSHCRTAGTARGDPRAMVNTLAVAVGLVAALLAGCSTDDTTTGWIPRHGTVSGAITVNGLPAPPVALPGGTASAVGSATPAFPASQAFASLVRRPAARSVRPRIGRGSHPAASLSDLIVTFRPGALGAPPVGSAALAVSERARAFGAAMRSHLAALVPPGAAVAGVSPVILAARIHVADAAGRDRVAAALRQDPAVASVAPARFIWLDETLHAVSAAVRGSATAPRTTPNDPFYAFQSWHYGLIDLPRAWSIGTGSASVMVAVVDEGIRFDHPAIAGNLTSDGFDFVNSSDSLPLCAGGAISNADDGNDYDPDPTTPATYVPDTGGTCFAPGALGGHGLHVAGTIGAVGNDGVGVTGINWAVKIRPIRVLGVGGFGTDYDVAQGILYAAGLPADDGAGGTVQAPSRAAIINLSLGSTDTSAVVQGAVVSAANAGALIVAAAGNDGSSELFYPAAYPQVLAVAAVGPDGAPAAYSNFGSYVGIRAPGGNFDLGDETDGVASTFWDFNINLPAYVFAEGTSMAAPHVSGVAALVLAHNPSLTAAELRSRLTEFAVGPATAYGSGLVNAYNSVSGTTVSPTQLYARLYAVNSGALVQTVATQAAGAFTFSSVEDGTYLVYGGADESGDQKIGVPGRRWGALGGWGAPRALTVFGKGPYQASFTIGLPTDLSAGNSTLGTAFPLMIGGYAQGLIVNPSTYAVYRVRIPEKGTYTFETSGWVASCGFALEEATAVGLFDSGGTYITEADFLDERHYNYCSRLTTTISPGTYYVMVAGAFAGGRFNLQARAGT